ncbi:MAG: DUF881 domain-containing protein [Actinomycetes bacterium]
MPLLRPTRDRLVRVARVPARFHAADRGPRQRRLTGRLLTAVVCAVSGLLIVISAANARGTDLRPGRNTDLVSLVEEQSRRNIELNARVTTLRAEVDRLAAEQEDAAAPDVSGPARLAGLNPVSGPAVTVTLSDAPASVAANGVDPDLLVVHQQDIQAVANALWSGGAEAMTIQGVRVISTTGIKCVGNTVVLHGIPYAPPYVVSAIGDPARLRQALRDSETVQVYQQYVDAYGLGYREETAAHVTFPGFSGSVDLTHARPLAPGSR